MRTVLVLALGLLAGAPALAQLKKTLHQTFEVPDSAAFLVFGLFEGDTYTIQPWAGNNIMTESQVSVYSSTQPVFDHLVENGRYRFEAREGRDTFGLFSHDLKRLAIRAAGMQAFEEVEVRIFIPDSFRKIGDRVYSRPKPEAAEVAVGKAPPVRKKLARESGEVSQELKESLQAAPDSLEIEPAPLPPADSTNAGEPAKKERRKRGG